MSITRRNFLKLGVAGVGVTAMGGAVLSSTITDTPTVSRVPIKIPDLPKEFENYKIGFLADIHMGSYLSHDFLATVVHSINTEKVDLLLLGGDYIWIEHSDLAKSIKEIRTPDDPSFSALPPNLAIDTIFKDCSTLLSETSTSDGIFAILGNHDRWESSASCLKHFNSNKVSTLVNQNKIVKRAKASLNIIGVDDYWTGIPSVNHFPSRKEPDEVRILLCHNPDYVSLLLKEELFSFDLALCGHTHAGQIKLPFVGALIHNVSDTRFIEGLVSLQNRNSTKVFTTRGVGMVEVPLRINCPPEIAILELSRA